MPLTRYQIRNEFSLADPELYKAADKDDPEALLEGIAMAGLVGVLRQLGDLAEFAAEIFHDLHEEVMATAARGHGLMARVQQLEAEFPSIEKAFLCQTNHSLFFTNAGVDWHPNLRTEHNLITRGDLPRCVLDSYEECRGPPRLFLLDKFDVAGAGACLKRYTDPSFFKAESAFPELAPIEVQREKKARKVKKKGSRWRNGETPEVAPTSHAKLHQLFLEERIENAYNDPTRLVKLKRRQLNGSPLESKSGKSYMEKFLQSPSPEHKAVYETFDTPPLSKMISDNSIESGLEIVEISAVSPTKHCSQGKENLSSSPDAQVALRSYMEELNGEVIDREVVKMPETTADFSNGIEKDILVDGECSIDGDHSDDMISEVDNYTDALTTMGSELDTDNEYRPKNDIGILDIGKYQTDSDINEQKVKAHTSDSHSVGISSLSDDGNSSFKKGRSSCSNSDTIDNMTEDMPSDGEVAAKAYPTNKNCVEIVEGQYIQLPAYAEMQCSTSDKALLPKDTFFGECISPDLGEAFYGSYLDDLNSTHVKLDEEASQMPISLAEPQLDEVPHEDVKTNSGMSDRDGGKDVIDSSEDTFADSCEKRETTLITCSAESHHVDGLGSRDTKFSLSSHDLSHSSNALLVVPEKSSNDSLDEVSKTGSATESCAESSVHQIQIFGPSNSDILPAEEQLPHSTLPEVERSSAITQSPEVLDVMLPVNFASEGNDVTLEAGINSDCMTPMVGTSQTCGFDEQQRSDISHDDRQLEGDSIEVVASYIECKQTVEQPFDVAKAEETCRVKTVEEDIVLRNLPSGFAHNLELDNHVGLDDLATENFYAEGIAVSAAASGSADFDNDYVDNTNFSSSTLIFSPSSNLKNLQEPLFGAGDQYQGGLESNEVISLECLKESKAKDVRNQVGGIPADVDSSEDKLATFGSFNLEDDIQYSLAEPTKNILNLSKIPASSELSDQELEPKYPSYLMESRSDVVSSPSGYLSEKETALEQSLDLHNDQHDEESLLLAEDISNSLNILSGQIQSWDNIDQERCSQTSSAHSVEGSSSLPTLEVSQQSDLQANQEMFPSDSAQPSLGLLHEATKVSLEEMPPLPPLPPMQWRTGKVQHASPASQRELAEHGQGSFPMIPAYATEQKANFGLSALEQGIEQPRNPFLPITNGELSSCHVPNQLVTDVSYPDTFPMRQSRMGKVANSQCDLDGTNPNRNPFLTLPTVTNESLEYSSVVMESDGVEFSHSLVPMLATEYTNPRLFPLSSQEKTEHAPNQFVPDKGLEGAEFQDSKQKYERENGNPDISVGQTAKTEEQSPTKLAEEVPTEAVEQFPAKVEEQPQHDLPSIERKSTLASNPIFLLGLAAAEGETTQTSNTNLQHNFSTPEGEAARPPHTLALLPVIEDGSTDGNPSIKPPRPRNPLIDAVAAHDKSKMRKATERFRPPTIPKVEERDSLLEQIRNKSFNLKPAAVTRPSIQGPKTNLRVAAILEKANAIRQALAGSDEDEDEDEDGWSDS